MTKYDQWLNTVPMKPTKKGVRIDLVLYIYPDGHGVISDQPVNNEQEAQTAIRDLWRHAINATASPAQNNVGKKIPVNNKAGGE